MSATTDPTWWLIFWALIAAFVLAIICTSNGLVAVLTWIDRHFGGGAV